MQAALTHTGRSLLALYFLYPGIMKFVAWDRGVTLMETHGMVMVPILLALARDPYLVGSHPDPILVWAVCPSCLAWGPHVSISI